MARMLMLDGHECVWHILNEVLESEGDDVCKACNDDEGLPHTPVPDKGYWATFLACRCKRDIETTERISGVGCCTKMLIYLVENKLVAL